MSLAITEKRQQQWRRPGGCVGIFLQFLDWKRRLAKKKLFSKKLLPPVRAVKRASKTFGSDDKTPMAKLLLITDENRGGFPSKKKKAKPEPDLGNGMGAPTLVARLMGLESMPVVTHERPRKAMDSKIGDLGKTESRPPKLRKTGEFLQRPPVEQDQGVRPNVLGENAAASRSSNKHHKLVSPVKSPRLLSGSHRARLMHAAATKILEPGMQPRDRAKCAITCSKRSKEQHLHNSVLRLGPHEMEPPFTTLLSSSSFKFGIASSSSHNSMGNTTKNKLNPVVQAQINMQKKACDSSERKCHLQNHQNAWKRKQYQPSMVMDKVADHKMGYRAKVCCRKQSGSDLNQQKTCMRSTGEVLNSHRVQMSRNKWEKNISCQRKIINFGNKNAGAFGSNNFVRESTAEKDLINRNRTASKDESDDSLSGRRTDMVSFTFNSSSIRHPTKSSSQEEMADKCRDQLYQLNGELSCKKNVMLDSMNKGSPSRKRMTLRVEEIRIRDDELETIDDQSTASLLEELVTSLTNGAPISEENGNIFASGSSSTEDSSSLLTELSHRPIERHQMLSIRKESQVNSSISVGLMLMDNDQPCPVSILEAALSNDSCSYGTIHASPGSQSQIGLTGNQNRTLSSDMDIDYLDSATTSGILKSDIDKIKHCTNRNFSQCSIYSCKTRFSRSKLFEAKQSISNAEVIFKNFALYASCGIVDFVLESLLLHMLEVTIGALPVGQKICCSYKDARGKDQLRGCLFDCMVQSIDSKYSHFCESGYKNLLRVPFFATRDWLIREVYQEIRGWMNLAGKCLDDLVEVEMYDSARMWKDCEIEVLETGMVMEINILEALVNEMVTDFC